MRVSEIIPYELRSLVGEEKYEGYTDDAEAWFNIEFFGKGRIVLRLPDYMLERNAIESSYVLGRMTAELGLPRGPKVFRLGMLAERWSESLESPYQMVEAFDAGYGHAQPGECDDSD